MPLAVVGGGFGRTGTLSLKKALEELGLGRCHHMMEVRADPRQLAFWEAAARGEMPDWDDVFAGFGACLDWPAVRFWREITAFYPDAKVILSVRPEASWLRSFHATIGPLLERHGELFDGYVGAVMAMAHEVVAVQTFGGRALDPEHALAVYRAHNAAVRAAIPAERLLVYDVAEGWAPLCAFLDRPVPEGPFPHHNQTAEWQARIAALSERSRT